MKVVLQVFGSSHPIYNPRWLLVLGQQPQSMTSNEIREANKELDGFRWVVADASCLRDIRRFNEDPEFSLHAGQVASIDDVKDYDPNWMKSHAA